MSTLLTRCLLSGCGSGAVLCVTMSSSGEQCFSGGVDGTIQSWNTPDPEVDPYDSYGEYGPTTHLSLCCQHNNRAKRAKI